MNFHFSANSNLNVHILILSPKIEVFPQRVETVKQVEKRKGKAINSMTLCENFIHQHLLSISAVLQAQM